jgi:hypothetical protein
MMPNWVLWVGGTPWLVDVALMLWWLQMVSDDYRSNGHDLIAAILGKER